MAEPQPPNVHEGAATPTGPSSDLTGAAALSSLSTSSADQDLSSNGTKKEVDGKALDKAMKGLSVKDKAGEDEKKKNVKIEAADVALLVSELEVAKAKATELLRANDGDTVMAMRAFVTAAP